MIYLVIIALLVVVLIYLIKKNEALKQKNHFMELERENAQKNYDEKLSWYERQEQQMVATLKAASFESLEKNQSLFLSLATATFEKYQERAHGELEKKTASIHTLFDPMKESLERLGKGVEELEKERKSDHLLLKEQISHLVSSEKELRSETAKLVRALTASSTRGRWGEMQLRRVVELCGMVSHCDFFEQEQEGNLRPDMIIRLPGERQVVVDAKTPFDAYFEAINTDDPVRKKEFLQAHARQIRAHMMALSKKSYWESFQPTLEFVVLFLPSEAFFSAALEFDPTLIEQGIDQKVIIATPVTLIGLLKSIAYGWKQEVISSHTKQIYHLGKELYKRISDMHLHLTKVGKSLASSVDHYNKCIGSWESRVLVSARKFEELGLSSSESMDISPLIELQTRSILQHEDEEL